MQLSNIKRIEVEAMAFAVFFHILVLLVYGFVAQNPKMPDVSAKMLRLDLGGLDSSIMGLEAGAIPVLPTLPENIISADTSGNAGSFGPISKIFEDLPPIDIKFNKTAAAPAKPAAPTLATAEVEESSATNSNYLELLQNTVQQKSTIPVEASMNNISGTASLRLEFDRKGYVLNYTLVKSTGNKILDNAALEVGAKLMIEPFPAPPPSFYPNQKILKFDFGIDYEPKQ